MSIRLEQIIPIPMLEQDTGPSEVWMNPGLTFLKDHVYLVQAPSGKGKTSLLSIIYGLRKDFQGKLFYGDEDTAAFTSRRWSELRKEKLSFIFQGLELFPELSAMENILLKNRITGFKGDAEIRDMAVLLGVDSHLHKKAGILSFGQQQRVAIIRALCQPFDFLLADECFSHMDRDNSRVAFDLISTACSQQGAGLLLTTLNQMPDTNTHQTLLL